MKPIFLLILVWSVWSTQSWAQDLNANADTPPNPNSTVITSEVGSMDWVKKVAVFTTNVLVVTKDYTLKGDELTIFFAATGGDVERILARGNVVIEQPDRTIKANQAEYFRVDDRMLLTGSPDILQKDGTHVTGNSITIYQKTRQIKVDGRTRMVLFKDPSDNSSSTPSPSPTQ